MSINITSIDEREKIILENIGLVNYILQYSLNKSPASQEYEDLQSIGIIGLIKAVDNFDKSTGVKFATYASKCISNEIKVYFKKSNKYAYDVSLNEPTLDDSNLTLEDVIKDPNSDFSDAILIKKDFVTAINIILNVLFPLERIVMFYWLNDFNQDTIGEILCISQSYVSRLIIKSINKLRNYLVNYKLIYRKFFSFSIVGNYYVFHFPICMVNSNFYNFFKQVDIDNINQQAIIKLPANVSSFIVMARYFQSIFTPINSSKNASKNLPKGYSNNTSKSTSVLKTSSEEDINIKNKCSKGKKYNRNLSFRKNTQSKKIADYIYTLDSFSLIDLKKHFSYKCSNSSISNILATLLRYNIIIRTAKGQYKVICNPSLSQNK